MPIVDSGDVSSDEEEVKCSGRIPQSLMAVEDAAVIQHSRQAVRMLPGGINIA